MEALKEWRNRSGLSQAALARLIGVSDSAVTKYEKGTLRISADLAKRIEAATNGEVTAAELLGLAEPTPQPKRSVREAPARFGDEETVPVPVPAATLERAREYGLDVPGLLLKGGLEAIRTAIAEACYLKNKEAFDWTNAHIREHGTFAEQMGVDWS